MVKINRQELLQTLEAVQPGLASREAVEQSSCFVFKDGNVITYNEEVACMMPFKLGFEGAVVGKKLVEILAKLVEEDLNVEATEGGLLFTGKKRRAQVNMEAEITLPIETIEAPTKWRDLPEEFTDAATIVQQCTVRQHESFCLTCVHIHPEFMEASDNFQITRYPLATGLGKPTLVKGESLRNLTNMGATEYSVVRNWLHFRNPLGLQLSCRRYTDAYPDTTKFLTDNSGAEVTLPGGLAEAVEKAEIFSSENTDNNNVTVSLAPGKMKIKGSGNSGWYEEFKTTQYKGPAIRFRISPKLLVDLTKKHTRCKVNQSRLKVDNGKFQYVTALGEPE